MTVAVIGGGIQGCTVAMELASRGQEVHMFEASSELMSGASRHSEGKIHLGYVYAAEPSLRTARLMARGALAFGPRLRGWLGPAFDDVTRSTPFTYAVHADSIVPVDLLEARYRRIAGWAPAGSGSVRRLRGTELAPYGPTVVAGFLTDEVAVDTDQLADLIAKSVIECDRLSVFTSTTVVSAEADTGAVTVLDEGGDQHAMRYDHVVNCAWAGRLAIDRMVGIDPVAAWTFRMKYFVRARLDAQRTPPPSTTVVLGPFGDIVDFGRGETYLSWYPDGCTQRTGNISPPSWPVRPDPPTQRALVDAISRGLTTVVPAIADSVASAHDIDVRGGVIYALGTSDVDDPASRFHSRYEVGITTRQRYHTIDTGKFTLAPLFASQLADRIAPRRGRVDT